MSSIVFIVGTSRSGTSAVQQRMVESLGAYSGPETHAFRPAPRRRWLRKSPKIRFLDKSRALFFGPELARLASGDAAHVAKAFRELAARTGVVVEKTPSHLQSIDLISELLPEACFVHCLREPAGLARSLYIASRQNQDLWKALSVEQVQRRIVGDLLLHFSHLGSPGHHFVRFERWEDDLQAVLPLLPRGNGAACAPLVLEEEHWRVEGFSAAAESRLAVPAPEILLGGPQGLKARACHANLSRLLELRTA